MKKKSGFITSILPGLMTIVFCSGLFAGPGAPGKSVGIGLDAGYALFSQDNLGKAPGFGLNFFYNLDKQFRVELKGAFIPIKTENDPQGLSKGTLNTIPIQLSLQLRLKISRLLIPYLGAGAGYYLNNFSIENKEEWQDLGFNINEEVDGVFGFHFGAGVDYFINPNMAFNIDFRYCIANLTGNYTITEELSGISHSGDIKGDINHILFGAGIKFLF